MGLVVTELYTVIANNIANSVTLSKQRFSISVVRLLRTLYTGAFDF